MEDCSRTDPLPPLSKFGRCKTVKAKVWPWFQVQVLEIFQVVRVEGEGRGAALSDVVAGVIVGGNRGALSLLLVFRFFHLDHSLIFQHRPLLQGAGFRVQGSGFRVQGSGCRIQGSGSGFSFQGSGFRVQGLNVRFRNPQARYDISLKLT